MATEEDLRKKGEADGGARRSRRRSPRKAKRSASSGQRRREREGRGSARRAQAELEAGAGRQGRRRRARGGRLRRCSSAMCASSTRRTWPARCWSRSWSRKIGHVGWYRLGQWKPELGEPRDEIRLRHRRASWASPVALDDSAQAGVPASTSSRWPTSSRRSPGPPRRTSPTPPPSSSLRSSRPFFRAARSAMGIHYRPRIRLWKRKHMLREAYAPWRRSGTSFTPTRDTRPKCAMRSSSA